MFFFSRSIKPKQFDFKPVYFDVKKEELEKRLQKQKKQISFKHSNTYKNEMYKRWDRVPYAEVRKQSRKRILMISIIFAGLLLFFALLLQKIANFLEQS